MMFGLIGMLVCNNGGGFGEPPRPDTGFFFDDTGFFDTDEDCTPWIDVEPDTLSFTYDEDDASSSTRELTIYNGGTCELEVWGFELVGDDAVFVVEDLEETLVEAGGQAQVPVHFQPSAPGEYSATLEIFSNDPYLPSVSVELTGTWSTSDGGGIPRVDDEDIRIEGVEVGCSLTYSLAVHNDGLEPLTLSELSLATASEDLTLLTEAPLEIAPSASAELEVVYAPLDRFDDSAVLTLNGDGEPASLTVGVNASAVMGDEVELEAAGDGATRSFPLPVEVVSELLRVGVDGVQQTEGWSHDGDANAVVFDEASVPAADTVISIGYLPQPECD